MDLAQTTAPKSDQQNFDDYAAGITRTVTIERVAQGSSEQPADFHLVEFPGRPYKPSKSMRRVIVAAWGPDTTTYAGRRMTLYGDPTVKFGGVTVGGIKISHLSHIEKPLNVSLTVSKGKRAAHTVDPLPATQPPTTEPTAAQVAASTDLDELGGMWRSAGPERRTEIEARVAALKEADQPTDDPNPGAPWGETGAAS